MRTIIDLLDEESGGVASDPDALVSALVAEVLRLAEEVCVARDHLDTALTLAAEGRRVDAAAIDAYAVPESAIEIRLARHSALYEEIYARILGLAGPVDPEAEDAPAR